MRQVKPGSNREGHVPGPRLFPCLGAGQVFLWAGLSPTECGWERDRAWPTGHTQQQTGGDLGTRPSGPP